MQRKSFFLIAFLCGVIAAGSMYFYLRGVDRNPSISYQPLVFAKSNITARTVIGASQLEIKNVPSQAYPLGGFSSIQQVAGSVALLNLTAGDIIIKPMIQTQNTQNGGHESYSGSSAALAVPVGKRAVAIPINLVSGVGYAVKPGDHVDVLVTMDIKNSTDTEAQTVTSLAAQDVLVLSVGDSSTSGDKSKVETKSYTLALSVSQAMAVTLGSEKGSLRLLLRNPVNTEIDTENPMKSNAFLDPNYFNQVK